MPAKKNVSDILPGDLIIGRRGIEIVEKVTVAPRQGADGPATPATHYMIVSNPWDPFGDFYPVGHELDVPTTDEVYASYSTE